MNAEPRMPRLLPSGWWWCICLKSCRCGSQSQRLNPPQLEHCIACGTDKPTVVTRKRQRPQPRT